MTFREFINNPLEEKKNLFLAKLKENQKILENLLEISNPSYSSFLVPYQKMNHDLDAIFTEISHLNSVKNNEETQKIYSDLLPTITEYYTNLSQNNKIFQAYENALQFGKDILTQPEKKSSPRWNQGF